MRHLKLVPLCAAALLLAACGGGGSDSPSVVIEEVPASATASVAAYVNYVGGRPTSETAEALDVTGVMPPTSETAEPTPL